METDSENQRPGHCEIISVPRKDTVRLLEVYIKRSISLNYGGPVEKKAGKKEKWVTMSKTLRRSSSDPSLHLHERLNDRESVFLPAAEPHTNEPMRDHEEPDKPTIKSKKSKKSKKPSLWKAFLGFFKNDDKDDERESPSEVRDEAAQSTNRSLRTHASSQKSLRKKSLKRKLSKRLSIRSSRFNTDLQNTDSAGVEAVISVEPTYSYYEKVSEELEKIVHEVQEKEETETLSNEEVIRRIVALTIQEGDAINGKLKDNPALNSFFQGISYSSFQKLADAYIEKEATPTHKPPTVLPTAPELVKLAFTLDFTARIAGLSKQNVGHITYLGHRYLQDRFEYRQACTDHPWSDSDDIDGVAVTDKQN